MKKTSKKEASMLIDNPAGNFRFLKGIGPFSSGVVAHPGYEVVHVTFHPLPPLQRGFELIERHLQRNQRPLNALCGMELRIPQPFSRQGFNEFNQPYIDKLAGWNLLVNGLNPVARTNVAPTVNPVSEPSVYGFSYTVPMQHGGATFVVSGAAEVQLGESGEYNIISHGDTSTAGLRQKAEQVLQSMTNRLRALQVTWAEVTTVEIYTVHNLHPLLATTVLPALQGASRYGVHWHYARPPVVELECEMDVRGVRQEIILPGENKN
jgi:hypothetical protein